MLAREGVEGSFDRIESIAEMHAQRLHARFSSESLYTGLYNPRWSHNPEEYKLEMSGDVERLRLKNSFLQPAPPPQCDSSPRRSPAVGTRSDESGVPRAETQQTTEEEGFFFSSSQCRWLSACRLHKTSRPGGH